MARETENHQAQERRPARTLCLDEPAWSLREIEEVRPNPSGDGSTSVHRIQYIKVLRDDGFHVFQKDMGSHLRYPWAHPLQFLALGEYSVGEVIEIAEYLREGQPEPEAPRDLFRLWLESLDEKQQLRAHRSVVGPWQRIQRN